MKRTDRKDVSSPSVFLSHKLGKAEEEKNNPTNPDPPHKPPSSPSPPRMYVCDSK
ncbi:hypothetical protein DSO57_1013519 [Entomophthora muscae]|uniref:Uncharacterized protein n=1 Tax=Entomophthora muscae TaxID=34485 RepID=A0ACC2UGH9_9FUNG|nr:hypothetical protein DSO57_1013519 [Entomophthora muscae]